MPAIRTSLLVLPLLAACVPEPGPPAEGTNISGLKDPHLPSDFRAIDYADAAEQALRAGARATLDTIWGGHMGVLETAPYGCPTMFLGPPPSSDGDGDLGEGMSWDDNCTTPEGVTHQGFLHWVPEVESLEAGSRSLSGDARVTDANGNVLFEFDGEANDSVDLSGGGWSYSSDVDGDILGTLAVGGESGLRATQLAASWSSDGTIDMIGQLFVHDGFGPPDQRTPAIIEEAGDTVPDDWQQGMPRFNAVRFDLQFTADCALEPVGYLGLRGVGGIWFDMYFLPKFDPAEDSAESNAFPYDIIVNTDCDGVGTVFVRNIAPEEEPWEPGVAPDFASVATELAAPPIDEFIYTIRDFPEEP
jgi:hypothetical protein